MRILGALVLLVLVAFVAAETHWGHHAHHKPPKSEHKNCHFQSDKGSYDLRLLMRDMNGKDWELRDEKTGSTFFFNPCGGVQNKACPAGAALCEITDKQLAVSYGSELSWAEGQENSVELTYANGEKCDNGMARKTLVQMTCSKPTADKMTQQTVITDMSIDECYVTLKMTSPYACAVEQLCSIYDKEECESSQGLCAWKHSHETAGKCVVTTSDCFRFGRHHLSLAAVIGLFGGLSVLAFCGVTLCCCVCCAKRRRTRALKKAALPTKAKKSKRAKAEELQELPQPQFIYQPLQQMQGYPGTYAEINPYTQVQFIPNTVN